MKFNIGNIVVHPSLRNGEKYKVINPRHPHDQRYILVKCMAKGKDEYIKKGGIYAIPASDYILEHDFHNHPHTKIFK